jgi:cytochrome c oxidase subunit II
VTGVLIAAAVRFSARPGSPEPTQMFGNRRVELAWTIAPTFLLIIAFGVTVRYIHNINSPEKGAIMNVDVVGHQWFWEFYYPPQPQFGISSVIDTADELHLPTGVNLHFHIGSHDVIHSFWTPQLQRQIDANPGQDNAVFVKLDQPGTYDGACYEFCGDGHAWMKYRVVVETPGQFRAWVQSQVKNAAKPTTSLELLGQKVFANNTCVSCHVITYPGSPAHGAVGPNLTHLASRWTIAAGAVPVTLTDLMGWIRDPNTYKPGALMPGFPLLKQHDLKALATYVLSLK